VQASLEPPDEHGLTRAIAEVALAPLAAGDYAVRVEIDRPGGVLQLLTGIRVVP
jgi:hypothetical protein